jgi:glycosyltransferase involved in cell wall biosynthesis
VIHSVWEEPLFALDQQVLAGKRIVCQVCNNLMRLHENPVMIRAADTVGLWIAMSSQAAADLTPLHYRHEVIPYSVDTQVFSPLHEGTDRQDLRVRYGVPDNCFILSNFMRDSFGHDLNRPKDQKGVELLLELGRHLAASGIPLHFLLAGPRRHWIRKQLREAGIGFTFVGQETAGDDLGINILSAEVIADLYRISDVHLVTSRWEGGPRSVLEAAAVKTPVLSTRVGIASDILNEQCLYSALDEALDQLKNHYETGLLHEFTPEHFRTIQEHHTVEANGPLFKKLYEDIESVEPYAISARWVEKPAPPPTLGQRLAGRVRGILGRPPAKKPIRISLWHTFHKPPYGGGNQFMMALQGAMQRQGVSVATNKLSRAVDAHICNSCWFDYRKFEKRAADFPVRMIHRIDGPVTLYRGEGRDEDETIFALNERFASATAFQSAYCFRKSYELGFRAVSPVVIHNGVDDSIFYPDRPQNFERRQKIRLITSAWSDNPRKGGAFLKWLDEALDWNRFEYTFVGRVNETFKNIEHIQAVPSQELADLLRQHDIYVSVSMHEPCSNALLEALSCGMPALYRDDGGNPELVSFGGLPFTDKDDVLQKLNRLTTNLESFQKIIYIRSIDDIARRYIKLAEQICDWSA